jgi:hypothetical protein
MQVVEWLLVVVITDAPPCARSARPRRPEILTHHLDARGPHCSMRRAGSTPTTRRPRPPGAKSIALVAADVDQHPLAERPPVRESIGECAAPARSSAADGT